MSTPSGALLTPTHTDGFDIPVTAEYIFITLRDVPFKEEGMHRSVAVGKGDPVSIDVPVRLVVTRAPAGGQVGVTSTSGPRLASWRWR